MSLPHFRRQERKVPGLGAFLLHERHFNFVSIIALFVFLVDDEGTVKEADDEEDEEGGPEEELKRL